MFGKAERGTDTVQSVTLVQMLFHEEFRLDVDPLGQPQRSGVPIPHSVFVKEWLREREFTITESTLAELFVFENAKSAKKLEVYAWSFELAGEDELPCYTFLLQVIDM